MRKFLENLVSILFLLSLSTAYFLFIAEQISPNYSLSINLALIPMMLGFFGYFIIHGSFFIVAAIISTLPIVHVLYFGGDSAKPGLEWFIGIIEFLFLFLGLVTGYLAKRYRSRQSRGQS